MKLDQHFLVDEDVLIRSLELADLKGTETVLEIGAGQGNLTEMLAKSAKKVISIELDESMRKPLGIISRENPNLKVIFGNALSLEWPEFDKMVSNLPYSISEPLLQKLVFCRFERAVLLVSGHFSNLLLGGEKTKLGLIAGTFFRLEPDIEVYPDSFDPPPRVSSRLLVLCPKEPKAVAERIFWEFLRQKDKIAKNALREAIVRGFEVEGKIVSKREARADIGGLDLEKRVSCLGLDELLKVRQSIQKLTH
ncbi:MAG: hypothetical protein JW727_02110 [Candidatus Aenigmarchaeota archaeon]|nr:hypothetical protein [Candidatus Aenigmarchaeota archaeon]